MSNNGQAENKLVDGILLRLVRTWLPPLFGAVATVAYGLGWHYVEYINGRLNEVALISVANKTANELLNQRMDLTTQDRYTSTSAGLEKERVNEALRGIRDRLAQVEQRLDKK